MAGSGESDLIRRVLAALPGTMQQLVAKLSDTPDKEVWAIVSKLRAEGIIKREPRPDGKRMFLLAQAKPEPAKPTEKVKVEKLQQVVFVSIKDWPVQQPGRPMVFDVRKTPTKANRTVGRMREIYPQLTWWFEEMRQAHIKEIQFKANSKTLRELMERRGLAS